MQLTVTQKVGGLHLQLAVFRHDFAHHTLDVVDTVFLHGTTVEFVKILTGGTHINIKYIHVGIGIFFPTQHSVLCGVHTADFGTIGFALAVVAPGADALHKHDGFGVRAVGGTEQRAAGRTCGVHQALKF